jgi:leukotriene-A4 hydrolase
VRNYEQLTLSEMEKLSQGDPCSFSSPDECVVTHLHLDLDVDFAASVLRGSVRVRAKKLSADVDKLVSNV